MPPRRRGCCASKASWGTNAKGPTPLLLGFSRSISAHSRPAPRRREAADRRLLEAGTCASAHPSTGEEAFRHRRRCVQAAPPRRAPVSRPANCGARHPNPSRRADVGIVSMARWRNASVMLKSFFYLNHAPLWSKRRRESGWLATSARRYCGMSEANGCRLSGECAKIETLAAAAQDNHQNETCRDSSIASSRARAALRKSMQVSRTLVV